MTSRWLRPVESWVKLTVVPPAGAAVIRALGWSMRIETRGHEYAERLYRELLLNQLTTQADEVVARRS